MDPGSAHDLSRPSGALSGLLELQKASLKFGTETIVFALTYGFCSLLRLSSARIATQLRAGELFERLLCFLERIWHCEL